MYTSDSRAMSIWYRTVITQHSGMSVRAESELSHHNYYVNKVFNRGVGAYVEVGGAEKCKF